MLSDHSGFKEFYPALCGLEQRVDTVGKYIKAVDNAYRVLWNENQGTNDVKYSPKLWFRGLRDHDYPLLPVIGRKGLSVEYENIYLSKFKAMAVPYLNQMSIKPIAEERDGYWDWLFLMQQYGAPTRLLDWSEDALVALVFAVDPMASDEEKSKDADVWCLNPIKLNTAFTFHDYYPEGYIPNVQEKGVYEIFGPNKNGIQNKKPAAVYSPMNSPRIIVQRGTFTVFPYTVPLEDMRDLPDSDQYLYKIVIAKEFRKSINEQLRRYGITKAKLTPELDSVAQEIFLEDL